MKIVENQKKDYTCGLVCVQYAYKKLTGKNISQLALEKKIGTNLEGYSHEDLVHLCELLGLKTKAVEGLKGVSNLQEGEDMIIILGWTPFYEHYSIFEGIIRTSEEDFVSLNEPDSPSYIVTYRIKDFKKYWKESCSSKWALIITKK